MPSAAPGAPTRREARAREREALKRLPRRERLRVWWRMRPLGVTFTVYLAVYLCGCDCRVARAYRGCSRPGTTVLYELEVTLDNGLDATRPNRFRARISMTPTHGSCCPPQSSTCQATAHMRFSSRRGVGDWKRLCPGWRTHYLSSLYATVGLVRSGQVQLYDWGLNYNEGYPQEDILEVNSTISADNLARYDELSRKRPCAERRVVRVDDRGGSRGDVRRGIGFEYGLLCGIAASRELDAVDPHACHGTCARPRIRRPGPAHVPPLLPRAHCRARWPNSPGAADRIAEQDLDFAIGTVRGRELGRLSETLEHMRASLLEAQRELWRTAESRRRLNAAFAHDLRTPITVLKGTVEMAQMRLRRGDTLDVDALDALSSQVARLERYATSMGGLTKLEGPSGRTGALSADVLRGELEHHVAGSRVRECGSELDLELASRSESAESIRHDMTVLPRSLPGRRGARQSVEQRLRACGVERDVRHNGRCGDSRPGRHRRWTWVHPSRRFTAVATRSSARTNQRSISDWGLNVSSVLRSPRGEIR